MNPCCESLSGVGSLEHVAHPEQSVVRTKSISRPVADALKLCPQKATVAISPNIIDNRDVPVRERGDVISEFLATCTFEVGDAAALSRFLSWASGRQENKVRTVVSISSRPVHQERSRSDRDCGSVWRFHLSEAKKTTEESRETRNQCSSLTCTHQRGSLSVTPCLRGEYAVYLAPTSTFAA